MAIKNLCVFCNSELEEELFNGVYGCDTGCKYMTIEISCPKCDKIIWSSGDFGSFGDGKWDYQTEEEAKELFMEEFAEHIERIKHEKNS